MKIILKSGKDGDGQYKDSMEIFDGTHSVDRLNVHSLWDCPEDAIVGRDLIPCWKIVSLMKIAYQLGKEGKELEIEEIEDDE